MKSPSIVNGPADLERFDSTFVATESGREVSATLLRPTAARCLYVLAHGAGAGMGHRFLEAMALTLAGHEIATFRYQFPYMEAGRRAPDPARVLESTVRSAVAAAHQAAPDLALIAGGKSMGGRITSGAAAVASLPHVRGLAFLGFPLHPAGKPSIERAEHLAAVELPMLLLQGTRDRLADLELLRPVIARLGRRAELHVVADADHSFAVLKRTGRSETEVLSELAATLAAWAGKVIA